MPSWNDLAVAAFITVLVFGGIYVPRLGDAIGRLVLGDRKPGDGPPDGGGTRTER
jgi:hypothetical protein